MMILDVLFFARRNQKLKKLKWQWSQNFDLNSTYITCDL